MGIFLCSNNGSCESGRRELNPSLDICMALELVMQNHVLNILLSLSSASYNSHHINFPSNITSNTLGFEILKRE